MGAWWLTATGTLITGFFYGLSKLLQWKKIQLPSWVVYYIDGIAYYFKTLIILLLVRSFFVEWSIVPSESLKPTLLVGDRVLTDKAAYGIRLPIAGNIIVPIPEPGTLDCGLLISTHSMMKPYIDYLINIPKYTIRYLNQKVFPASIPKRGDVVVFRSPLNSSVSLIKRVIGLPGDRVQYCNQKLFINQKAVNQTEIGVIADEETEGNAEHWLLCQENLDGVIYHIYRPINQNNCSQQTTNRHQTIDKVVPPNHYFVMGDHRDRSIDSRVWGFLPDHCLLGKAKRIYLSRAKPMKWWKLHHWLRWKRLGQKIK